jgi:hypothetical protein
MLLLVLVHLLAIQDDNQLRLTPWSQHDIKHYGGLAIPGHHGVAHHHHHQDGEAGRRGCWLLWPGCKMGRRARKSGYLATQTISGSFNTSMPRRRLHVLSYQSGPFPGFGNALDYRGADLFHGTTSPRRVSCGPPPAC